MAGEQSWLQGNRCTLVGDEKRIKQTRDWKSEVCRRTERKTKVTDVRRQEDWRAKKDLAWLSRNKDCGCDRRRNFAKRKCRLPQRIKVDDGQTKKQACYALRSITGIIKMPIRTWTANICLAPWGYFRFKRIAIWSGSPHKMKNCNRWRWWRLWQNFLRGAGVTFCRRRGDEKPSCEQVHRVEGNKV